MIRQILEESKAKTDELNRLFVLVNLGAKTLIESESTLQSKNRDLKQEKEDLEDRLRAAEAESERAKFGISASAGNPLLQDEDELAYGGAKPRQDLDQAVDEDDMFNDGNQPPAQTNQYKQDQILSNQPVRQAANVPGNNNDEDNDFFDEPSKPTVQNPSMRPGLTQQTPPEQEEEDFFGEPSNPKPAQPQQPSTQAPPTNSQRDDDDFFGESGTTYLF